MRSYLEFGGAAEAERIEATETLAYLRGLGFGGGYLEQARAAVDAARGRRFRFEPLNANYCDFCFAKLMGGEYDRLRDGRERCIRCSRTVVGSQERFIEVFLETRRNLEAAFGITLGVSMTVRMVNAREIARRTGEVFQPTPGVDARVLGFATATRSGYSLYIENGSPKLAAITTTAHELTHIWQYLNWRKPEIIARYGAAHQLAVYEGMATWAQVQYLLDIREYEYADRQEAYAEQRTDEYGAGFRAFRDRYPLDRLGAAERDSPFRNPIPL